MKKYLVHAVGTFASGKSTLISSVGLSYGVKFKKGVLFNTSDDNTCLVLGIYTLRDNRYTGGLDAKTMKKEERYRIIKEACESDYNIVAFEGTMIGIYKGNYRLYEESTKNRKRIIIFLDPPFDVILERVKQRRGKDLSKKTIKNLKDKRKMCEDFFNYFKDKCIPIKSEFTTEEHHLQVLKEIEKITGIKMKDYILKPKINTLFDFV